MRHLMDGQARIFGMRAAPLRIDRHYAASRGRDIGHAGPGAINDIDHVRRDEAVGVEQGGGIRPERFHLLLGLARPLRQIGRLRNVRKAAPRPHVGYARCWPGVCDRDLAHQQRGNAPCVDSDECGKPEPAFCQAPRPPRPWCQKRRLC